MITFVMVVLLAHLLSIFVTKFPIS